MKNSSHRDQFICYRILSCAHSTGNCIPTHIYNLRSHKLANGGRMHYSLSQTTLKNSFCIYLLSSTIISINYLTQITKNILNLPTTLIKLNLKLAMCSFIEVLQYPGVQHVELKQSTIVTSFNHAELLHSMKRANNTYG